MASIDRDRGLAEKPLRGPIVLLLLALGAAYYVWLLDPFKVRPVDPNARRAEAPAKRPGKVAEPRPEPTPEPSVEPDPATPATLGDGLVRAPRAIEVESRLDPGTSVAAGDAVMWLEGAIDLKAEILTVNENIARYDRRIASGVEVKATQRKLDEQLRKLSELQERYQERIITAPISGIVMMIGSGSSREEGEPLFQILPE